MKTNPLVAALGRLFHIGTGDIQTQSPAFNFAGLPVASTVDPTNLIYVVQNGQGFQMPMSMAFSIFDAGGPQARSVTLGNPFQASTPTKPAHVSINLNSIANFSLAGGTTITGTVFIAPTLAAINLALAGSASPTAIPIAKYKNSITGTIAVGLNMNSEQALLVALMLPIGWYFGVRQTSSGGAGGTLLIDSAFDQTVG